MRSLAATVDCSRICLQADNYTSIGAFEPELNPEQGRLAWSLIIVFIASVSVSISVYNLARLHAAYWLTMQPRREEFSKIVAERMIEREAESTGILAWIAHKNTGKGAILVHAGISTVRYAIHESLTSHRAPLSCISRQCGRLLTCSYDATQGIAVISLGIFSHRWDGNCHDAL